MFIASVLATYAFSQLQQAPYAAWGNQLMSLSALTSILSGDLLSDYAQLYFACVSLSTS